MEHMDHNAHSVYLMYYHLIMVVKYRRKVINDPISERAKEIWEYIAPRYGIVLEEWNYASLCTFLLQLSWGLHLQFFPFADYPCAILVTIMAGMGMFNIIYSKNSPSSTGGR